MSPACVSCHSRSDAQTPCVVETRRGRISIVAVMITRIAELIPAKTGWSISHRYISFAKRQRPDAVMVK